MSNPMNPYRSPGADGPDSPNVIYISPEDVASSHVDDLLKRQAIERPQ